MQMQKFRGKKNANPVSFIDNFLRIFEICSPLSSHRKASIFHKFVNLCLLKNFADQI